jgi:hypothetical protein
VKLLVTGGAGYIGSIVTAQLLQAGHQVTVLDDLSTGHADAVPDGASLIEGSLLDETRLAVVDEGFDGVLHFAAKSLVAESTTHPERYWTNNLCGTLALLEAMRTARIPRLVFSSTAAVYGEPDQVPILETAPTRPTSAYGASKLAVDLMIGTYAEAFGTSSRSCSRSPTVGAIMCRSTAPTTPPLTARPSATTSTSRTLPGYICSPLPQPNPAATPSTTWAMGRGTRSGRSSRPPGRSPAGSSRRSTRRAGPATRPCWSLPAPGSAPS